MISPTEFWIMGTLFAAGFFFGFVLAENKRKKSA